jgi:hypothetical protein
MRTISLFAFLCGCAVAVFANVLPQDSKDFHALVEREIPIGTSIQLAKSRVEALGLACTLVRGGWINNINDRTAFHFCERQSGSVVLTRWLIFFLPKQEKVAVIRADVVLVGP